MKRRVLDGEYRQYEPDPELVREIAVDLLTRMARDAQALSISTLAEDYPAFRDSGLSDSMLDDFRDAVYEACARAVITIPDEAES